MPRDEPKSHARTWQRKQLLLLQHAVQHVVVNLRRDLKTGIFFLADLLEEVHAMLVDQAVHHRGGNFVGVLVAEHFECVLRVKACIENRLWYIESRTLGTR